MKLTKKEKSTTWAGIYNLLSNLKTVDSISKKEEKILFKVMDKLNLEVHCKKEMVLDTACYVVDKTVYIDEIDDMINDAIENNSSVKKIKITIDFL